MKLGTFLALNSLDREKPTALRTDTIVSVLNCTKLKEALSCIECRLLCYSQVELDEHVYISHKSLRSKMWISDAMSTLLKSMSCIECHLLCDSKRLLDQHVYMVHESINPYEMVREKNKPHNLVEKVRCVHCKKLFPKDKHYIWSHVKKEKCECFKNEHQCDECGEIFKKIKEFNNHKLGHKPRKAYPCVFKSCNRSYDDPKQLKQHVRDCHTRTKNGTELEDHVTQVQNATQYERCEDETELEGHIKRSHNTKSYPFECSVCQKKFRLKADMSLHVGLVHEGKKRKTCSECGKLYFESDLEEHIQNYHLPKTEN